MATVGCSELHAIPMTDFKEETYDLAKVKDFPVVKTIDINPNTYEVPNVYNDGVGEIVSGISDLEVAINTADLTPEEMGWFFNVEKDGKGVYIFRDTDKPRTVAILFQSLLSDLKNSRYTCIYKCTPKMSKESFKSKIEKGVEFMDKQIIFKAVPLIKKGDLKGGYKAQVDSTDTAAQEAITNWYKSPYGYTAQV